jgi:hypothetical protein
MDLVSTPGSSECRGLEGVRSPERRVTDAVSQPFFGPDDPFRPLARPSYMRGERIVTAIRRELRERLMSDRRDGVDELLRRLWALGRDDAELRVEHARWAMRFELLAAGAAAGAT